MDLGLNDKTALVFGAGGGLGGAIARTLAKEGANIVVADVNREAAQATADAITSGGGKATVLEWDLADLSIIDAQLKAIEHRFGAVNVLVNNTGGPPPTPVAGQDAETWQRFFNSMVLPVIAITDRVLPAMKAAKWGRIITSTSSGVIAPIANLGVSNTLRSALLGWSKTLAQEVGRDGITANIVLPGRIATHQFSR
jgi:3-oxoacyl-[acyl-carrier protein] reductase